MPTGFKQLERGNCFQFEKWINNLDIYISKARPWLYLIMILILHISSLYMNENPSFPRLYFRRRRKKGQKNGALRETRKKSSLFLERLLSKTMITLFRFSTLDLSFILITGFSCLNQVSCLFSYYNAAAMMPYCMQAINHGKQKQM